MNKIYETLYIRDFLKENQTNISCLNPHELELLYNNILSNITNKDIEIEKIKEKYKELIDSTQNKSKRFWIDDNDYKIEKDINTIDEIQKARSFLSNKNILVLAGAGMSVDSSLKTFENIINIDKDISYEFEAFDKAIPHVGYSFLKNLEKEKNLFVMTTNIDNLFLKAGFNEDSIYECHGNYSNRLCKNCDILYKNKKEMWECPTCERELIPHFIKIGKPGEFDYDFLKEGEKRLKKWMDDCNNCFTILEVGCGIQVPVLRDYSEMLIESKKNVTLIRVNPSYPYYNQDKMDNNENDKKVSILKMGILDFIKNIENIKNINNITNLN